MNLRVPSEAHTEDRTGCLKSASLWRRTKGYHACTELETVEEVALWATKITFFLLGYEYHASNEATDG